MDAQGVSWWELGVPKEAAKAPMKAFGAIPIVGGLFGSKSLFIKPERGIQYLEEQENTEPFKQKISYNETRGVQGDVYSFRQPSGSKTLGDAIGKYQVTEGELKTYAKRYLGRDVGSVEFRLSPNLQEQYMDAKIRYLRRALHQPDDEILAIHRGGMNATTTERAGYINAAQNR
mgnify:FL=1